MNIETVINIKKFLAIITAVGIGILSIYFSNRGFGFQVENMAWGGWMLAISVTVVEFVFSSQAGHKGNNLTIYSLGLAAYAYDIVSNFLGIFFAQGVGDISQILVNPFHTMFCLIVAAYIAILPEFLLVFGLIGISDSGEGDFIKNLFKIKSRSISQNNPQSNQQNNLQSNQQRPSSLPNSNNLSLPQNVHRSPGRPKK